MNKILHALLLIGGLLIISQTESYATHVMGSDITWKCVGKDSFLITVSVYRDCNGVSLSGTSPTVRCANTSQTFSVSSSMGAGVDITPVCDASCTKCESSGCSFPYGIQRYEITGIVYLGNTNCCDFTISWGQCCRNSNITTGPNDQNFYVEAKMSKCDTPCNSSPRFTNPPLALICVGQCFIYNQGVVDDDGDSLVYSLVQPMQSASGPVTYSGQYSYDKPLYFFGFPNKNLSFNPPQCRGFHLDSLTGDLKFRPMQAQITVMAIKVEEYRNGVKIGETRRDVQIIVTNCPNNDAPSLSGINGSPSQFSTTACPGDNLCFTVNSSDQNNNDSVEISWNAAIPGARFTVVQNGKYQNGTFCWTPTEADVSTTPYFFTVTAQDDACPIRATTVRSYQITVKPNPVGNLAITDLGCGKYQFDISTSPPGATIVWNSPPEFLNRTQKTITHQFQRYGPIVFEYTAFANGCSKRFKDSLNIPAFTTLDLGRDSVVCSDIPFDIEPAIGWGVVRDFSWSTGDTTDKITVVTNKDTIFKLNIMDTMGCPNSDSIRITVNKPPVAVLPQDQRICDGAGMEVVPVITFPDAPDTVVTYEWYNVADGLTFSTDSSVTIYDSGRYAVRVIDSLGCYGSDSINVYVNPPIEVDPPGDTICYGESSTLSVSAQPGPTTTIGWSRLVTGNPNQPVGNTQQITVSPTQDTYYRVQVTQSHSGVSCSQADTVLVKVNPLPTITFTKPADRCVNANSYSLVTHGSPRPGTWTGKGVISNLNLMSPTSAGAGTHMLTYAYTDNNGCSNTDSIAAKINPLPVVNAGRDTVLCTNDNPVNLTPIPFGGSGKWRGQGIYTTGPISQFRPGTVSEGTYQLIYNYEHPTTGCINEDTMVATVYKSPEPETGTYGPVCVGSDNIQLQGTPAGGTWSGQYVNSGEFTPSTAGTYWLVYTYTGPGDCTEKDSTQITVNEIPAVTAATEGGVTKVCEDNDPVELLGTPAGFGGVWKGAGVNNSGSTKTFNPGTAGPGNFTLTYVYTDANGCTDSATTGIEVQEKPTVEIVGDPIFCKNEPYTLTADYTGAPGITWTTVENNGTFDDPNANTVTYSLGTGDEDGFMVVVTTNDYPGGVCGEVSDQRQMQVFPDPKPEFTGFPLEGCAPHEVTFEDETTIEYGSIAEHRWTFGDGGTANVENPQYTYQDPGTYTVTLWVKSDNGCEAELTKPQYITVQQVPVADFEANPPYTTIAAPTIQFINTSRNTLGPTYSWNFDDFTTVDGGTSTQKDPSYMYQDTGFYDVMLIVTNSNGCKDTAIKRLLVDPDITIFIPNAMRPKSGIGENQVFKPEVIGVLTYHLSVYDRWGELLWETTDTKGAWDGTFRGVEVPEGVYVYVIKATSFENAKYTYTGTITLLKE